MSSIRRSRTPIAVVSQNNPNGKISSSGFTRRHGPGHPPVETVWRGMARGGPTDVAIAGYIAGSLGGAAVRPGRCAAIATE